MLKHISMKDLLIPGFITSINESDELVVDMSDIGDFPVPIDKQKLASFIFIRNSGIKMKLDFSKCSYEDKDEFLMLWMTSGIEVKSEELAISWIEILHNSDAINKYSILDENEIKKFNSNHSEFISVIREFINSLPLYAISTFHEEDKEGFDLSEFDVSEEDNISMCNFYQLTQFPSFNLLLEENAQPKYFKNIFNNFDNAFYLSKIMDNLPYIDFMLIMFGSPELQQEFINNLNDSLQGGNDNG